MNKKIPKFGSISLDQRRRNLEDPPDDLRKIYDLRDERERNITNNSR